MSAFTDFLLNTLSGTLTTVGESKLIEVLQQLHAKDVIQYEAAIRGGHSLVLALLPIVVKTGNKIDDAIVNSLDEAIKVSAKLNDIIL